MSKFFSTYKVIFYLINVLLIILYLYPGSLLGWIIYDNKSIQPQITPDFVISSNHFYVFVLISIIGFLTFAYSKKNIPPLLGGGGSQGHCDPLSGKKNPTKTWAN